MADTLRPDDYQPRILGTGHSSHVPVTELVIVGKDQLEALSELLGVFREHRVELLGLESQSVPESRLFIITTFTDMTKADCSLKDLLATLRNLLVIDSAKGVDLEGSAYERFLFPVVALDGSRLITSTARNVAEVERYFSSLPYEGGNLVMFATGRQSGLALVRTLRRTNRGEFQNEMLGMAVDELRTNGWAIFTFDVSMLESGTIKVSVKDSIVREVPGTSESWMTYGLSAGIIEGIYGMVGDISASRTYSAKSGLLRFKVVELTSGQTVNGTSR